MRGARLLLGTAVAGSLMAAATESEAINVAEQRILLAFGRAVWQALLTTCHLNRTKKVW